MEQLVNQDSKGPYISLWAIDVADESFRRHIDWRSDVYVLELLSL
jgi:hypothetical protein